MKLGIQTLLMVLIFNLITVSAYSFDIEQEDKQKHMAVSTAISAPTYLTMRNQKYSRFKSASMAIFMTLFVGFAKEQTDDKSDPEDMQANAVGAFGGVLLPLSFNF